MSQLPISVVNKPCALITSAIPFSLPSPLQALSTGKVVHQTAMQCQARLMRPKVKPVLPKVKEVVGIKQGIKQKESLEIVQTLLGASVCASFPRCWTILIPSSSSVAFHFYGRPRAPFTSVSKTNFNSGLLPEESFEEVRYGAPDTPLASYNWFANGGDPESTHPEKARNDSVSFSGTRMKRLKRGYSSEADHLLNWLVRTSTIAHCSPVIDCFSLRNMGYLKLCE